MPLNRFSIEDLDHQTEKGVIAAVANEIGARTRLPGRISECADRVAVGLAERGKLLKLADQRFCSLALNGHVFPRRC